MSNKSKTDNSKTTGEPAKVISIEPRIEEKKKASRKAIFLQALIDPDNPSRIASDLPFDWVMLTAGLYRGIYKLAFDKDDEPKPKTILTASVKISRVVMPANERVRGDSQYHCEFTNQAGETKTLIITSSHFFRDELIRFFDGFAEVGTERGADIHVLRQVLSRLANQSKDCLKQSALDSLGWYEQNRQLEFLRTNGNETRKGFVPVERAKSAFASELRLDARGGEFKQPSEEIFELLANWVVDPETLMPHPDYEAILFGAIGFVGLLSYPHLLDDGGFLKRAQYEFEIVGGSGVGKSPFASIIKWFFTLAPPPPGEFRLPADLVEDRQSEKKGDTLLGRNLRLAASGNIPLIDYDFRRVTDPSDPTAERRLRVRTGSIDSISNNEGGGTTGMQRGGARQRPERQGGLIRTLEDDPALVTLPLYWSTEKRSYLHTWAQTESGVWIEGQREINTQIVERHSELYMWGAFLLRFLMSKPKTQLPVYFNQKTDEARDITRELWPNLHRDATWQWGYAMQNITAALIWIDALRSRNKKSFFAEWLESGMTNYVRERRARFEFLLSIGEGGKLKTPADVYLKSLRKLLRFGDGYIARQCDGMPLERADFEQAPFEPADVGYQWDGESSNGEKRLRHGRQPVGYLSDDCEWFLMHRDSFDLIKEQARRDDTPIRVSSEEVNRQLAKKGAVYPEVTQVKTLNTRRATVARRQARYLHISTVSLLIKEGSNDQ